MSKKSNSQKKSNAYWSDYELRASVKTYAQMLKTQIDGNFAEFPRSLSRLKSDELSSRSLWSIKLRMQNISSVLFSLKFPVLRDCGISHNIGSGVKDRVISMLHEEGIGELKNFMKTSDPGDLEKRVTKLRKSGYSFHPIGSNNPEWEIRSTKSYIRCPDVKAWILENANGICEGCKKPAQFQNLDGFPYLEVHHVLPLAKNGSDKISNTVALCPNCHMRCHYSIDRDEFKLKLYQNIKRLVLEVPDPDIEIENSILFKIAV